MARHLFEWSADAKLADFYERALLNGIVGNQNRLDPNVRMRVHTLKIGIRVTGILSTCELYATPLLA